MLSWASLGLLEHLLGATCLLLGALLCLLVAQRAASKGPLPSRRASWSPPEKPLEGKNLRKSVCLERLGLETPRIVVAWTAILAPAGPVWGPKPTQQCVFGAPGDGNTVNRRVFAPLGRETP